MSTSSPNLTRSRSTAQIHPISANFYADRSLNIGLPLLHTISLLATAPSEVKPPLLTCAMGLLEKLWDDTVAGPRPDSGLGKLRKYNTFDLRSSSGKDSDGGGVRCAGCELTDDAIKVTRSIMIVKPPGYQSGSPLVSPSSSTPPISPAGSTPPVSPFSGSRQAFRFRRRSTSDAYEKASEARATGPSSP